MSTLAYMQAKTTHVHKIKVLKIKKNALLWFKESVKVYPLNLVYHIPCIGNDFDLFARNLPIIFLLNIVQLHIH